MINNVTLEAVYTHTSISSEIKKRLCTLNKGVSFFSYLNFLNRVNVKCNKKLDIRHNIIVSCF